MILKYVARKPGCSNGDIKSYVHSVSPGTAEQVGGYLKVLMERYRMVERKLPIFSKRTARRGRYYIRDNFLRSWLSSLAGPVSAINFRPESGLVDDADQHLQESEGFGLERLVATLYEERSRKGLSGFPLTRRIEGYWDRKDTELDLVALNEQDSVIRLGTCKRSAGKLVPDLDRFDRHIDRFLASHRRYAAWTVERVAIAPSISPARRREIESRGYIPQDLVDLTRDL